VHGRFGYMPDEEVVLLARDGQSEAIEFLISRYRTLVESKAKAYFVIGADHEDVVQEGMIGLYKAIRDFRTDRLAKFRPFAELCVTRQIITAVKTATRQKHVPLNGYVPIEGRAEDEIMGEIPVANTPVLALPDFPPALPEMVSNTLSPLEKQVLRCYLDGMSYGEMSDSLACHTKSIDNALQRVKRKVSGFLKR
jgi:RNA polymerase sporulation-specific sigma factor